MRLGNSSSPVRDDKSRFVKLLFNMAKPYSPLTIVGFSSYRNSECAIFHLEGLEFASPVKCLKMKPESMQKCIHKSIQRHDPELHEKLTVESSMTAIKFDEFSVGQTTN
uniref:Uncharacterized protein n=1 Tax=Romanomermis culicivorax TaxID=13658 RepID=A0A915I0X8_ROMCU